jgi:hypothetical protein
MFVLTLIFLFINIRIEEIKIKAKRTRTKELMMSKSDVCKVIHWGIMGSAIILCVSI